MIIAVKDKWAMMIKDDSLRQNSKKTYEVEFAFDESWSGFTKTAIFEAGPVNVMVALSEDRCVIPQECLKYGSVKLKIGLYGVKGDERKAAVWCETSMIIPDSNMDIGASPPSSDDAYSEIMAAIGDLSAAGFEGKTLAEIFLEIKNSRCECETAEDEEVDSVLNEIFSQFLGGSTPAPAPPGQDFPYGIGHGLKVVNSDLTVDTVDDFQGDNTLPMTAAGVETVVGNIEALLAVI